MAIIRNAANKLARGRSGQSTYYVANGRQIERPALNNSNYGASARRSAAQQIRRVKWANLVNLYKISSSWMPKAFESKKKGQTDYNKFMQVNVNNQNVALTRDEALNGAIVVCPVQLTQGSLTSISMTKQGNAYVSNLAVGNSFVIDATTTIGQLTTALVANTPFVSVGMQLSFVQYLQNVDANNIPHATCNFFEITLDSSSEELVVDYLPEDALSVLNGFIATASDIDLGGFAYILSQKTNSGLKVSSQNLVTNNDTLVTKYTGAAQVNKAIDSYGLDTEVILNPESVSGASSVVTPQFISGVTLNGNAISAGAYIGAINDPTSAALVITMANRIKSSTVSVVVTDAMNHTATATGVSISGKQITATVATSTLTAALARIAVIGEEDEYGWDFATQPAPAAMVPLTIQTSAAPYTKYSATPKIYVNNVEQTVSELIGSKIGCVAQVPQNQQSTIRVEANNANLQFSGWTNGTSANPTTVVVTEAMAMEFSIVDLGDL